MFELANKGMVFLDEIGEMPVEAPVRLLRVLESMAFRRVGGEREIRVDARLIAATNRDLAQRLVEGAFREDLFFRLNVVAIHVPSLAERREAIPALVGHFLRRFGRLETDMEPAAVDALTGYDWPGNIRELRNALERALIFAGSRRLAVSDFAFLTARGGAAATPPPAPPATAPAIPPVADALEALGRAVAAARMPGLG